MYRFLTSQQLNITTIHNLHDKAYKKTGERNTIQGNDNDFGTFSTTTLIRILALHRTCTYIEFNAIMNITIPLKCVALVVIDLMVPMQLARTVN